MSLIALEVEAQADEPASTIQQPVAVQTKVDPAPPIELKSARDLMSMYGVDGTRLGYFNDGQAIQPDEVESLLRVLMAVRRFSYGELLRWRQTDIPWGRWADEPYNERGEVIALKLRVQMVKQIPLADELAERFEMPHYYQCEATIDGNQPTTIYTLQVPKKWAIDKPIDEPSTAAGFFIKLADAAPRPLHPIFVAQRLALLPDTELGRLGMDVSLFDDVQNQTKFELTDGPCFYELLAAVGRASVNELLRLTKEEDYKHQRFPVEPLFNHPDQQFGKLIALSGTAKSCIRVTIENPDVIKVLGYDHYYMIELFTIDSQGNPVTFCVRELPEKMKTGEQIAVDMRVAGFFFKTWKYPTFPSKGKVVWQIAPLVVGRAPVLLEQPKVSPGYNIFVTGMLTTGFLVVAMSWWWLTRGDRRAHKRLEHVIDGKVTFDGVTDDRA